MEKKKSAGRPVIYENERRQFHIFIDVGLFEILKKIAAKENRTVSAQALTFIKQGIEKQEGEKKGRQ